MHLTRRAFFPLLAAPFISRPSLAQNGLAITPVVGELEEPWAVDFLPDGRFIVTEKAGRLSLYAPEGGRRAEIGGLPEVAAGGQGGLLDVHISRDFESSRRLWISYSARTGEGAATALAEARLSADDTTLSDFRVIFEGPGTSGGRHFGSRVVEGIDGTIFLTTGDRGQRDLAQDIARPEGKVLAFQPDGRPRTNPMFEGSADLVPGLWSYGHRNIQGAALDADGQLWTVEHGDRGGDELNRVGGGRNHGWPVISYGVQYNGDPIGEGTAKEGMEQPIHYWDPSIAPSGLAILTGQGFPDWRGHILTGSLNSDFISRLDPSANYQESRIETAETARVRDVREGPDGAIWFLSVGNEALYRITAA